MAIRLGIAQNKVIINQGNQKQINLTNPEGKVNLRNDFNGNVDLSAPSGKVDLSQGSTKIPVYSGEYEVIPKVEEDIILETSGYAMAEDVVVKEIPYYEVKNSAGGITFTIGK